MIEEFCEAVSCIERQSSDVLIDSRAEARPQLVTPVDDQVSQLFDGASVTGAADAGGSSQLSQYDAAWGVDVDAG